LCLQDYSCYSSRKTAGLINLIDTHKSDQTEDMPREIRQLALDAKCSGQYEFAPRPKRKPVKLSRQELLLLLEECGWNKAEVARRVGLSRTAIWKYMKKWDIPLRNNT